MKRDKAGVSSCVWFGKHSQELPDVAPVHTHRGHFGAAVLVKLVAARLTSEAVQKKLLAYVTKGQLQKGFSYLSRGWSLEKL